MKFTGLDIIGLASLFVFVLSVLALAEILRRKDKVDGSTSRKIVHLSVGNVILVFPFFFSNVYTALIGPIFFIPFTFFTCPASPIKKFRLKGVEEGHTFGTVFYAIALTVLVGIFFYPDPTDQNNVILFASFLPLVWGDGMSAVIGTKFGEKSQYRIFGSTKSLLGSWTAAFASLGSVTIGCLILAQTLRVAIYIGLLAGFITAIIEAITPKGFDNLAIPAANAVIMFLLYRFFDSNLENLSNLLSINSIISAFAVGLTVAVLGIVLKALTWDGAIAGFYFGFIILGLGSWTWGAMYISFFIIGSLFTFIGKDKKKEATDEFEKGDTARDSVQAMVNSIIPSVLAFIAILVIEEPIFTIMAAGAFATSLSDTLGTEIGALSRNKPRLSIKPWKTVEKGTPGAVSIIGLLASIIATGIIGGIGVGVSFLDNFVYFPASITLFLVATVIGGFIGSYADSIFACTIQKMNKCKTCNKITEKDIHCDEQTEYYSGIKWMHNDVVNLFSVAVGAVISAVFYLI